MKFGRYMKIFVTFAIAILVFLTPSLNTYAQDAQANTHNIHKRSILNPHYDRREKVVDTTSPIYSSIGRVTSPVYEPGYISLGTGFVVGKNTFVTNNHVAVEFKYSKLFNQKATDDAWFYPGKNRDKLPFGKFKVIDVVYSPKADIAVVTVGKQNDQPNGQELGDVVKPFQLKQFDKNDTIVTISGYPGEKQDTQWFDINRLDAANFTNINTPFLTYDIDTTAGQSGSPIYNNKKQVVGVHSNGDIGDARNSGQRLNKVNYDFIVNQVNEENQKLQNQNNDIWAWN